MRLSLKYKIKTPFRCHPDLPAPQNICQDLKKDSKSLGFKVWDGPALSAHIKAKYNIEISVRQCQRLFRNLGFSRIRPQPYPSKGYEDTEEREAFKKNGPKSSRTNL